MSESEIPASIITPATENKRASVELPSIPSLKSLPKITLPGANKTYEPTLESDTALVSEPVMPMVFIPQAFNNEAFEKCWQVLIDTFVNDNKKMLALGIQVHKPEIIENSITIKVENSVVAQLLNAEKGYIIKFFKEQMAFVFLDLNIIIDDAPNEILPYSAKEKYEYLLNMNPELQKLKDELGLELDF